MAKKEKQKKRFLSIRSQIALSLAIVSVITITFSLSVSYQLASDRVMDISMRLSSQSMSSQGKAVQDHIVGLQNTVTSLQHLDSLHALAHMEVPTAEIYAEYERDFGSVAQKMINETATKYAFNFVGIYLENGYTFKTNSKIRFPYDNYEDCLAYYAKKSEIFLGSQYVSGQWFSGEIDADGENMLTYVRFLYDRTSFEKLGLIVYGVQSSQLDKIADSGVFNCFLIASDGTLISETGSYLPGTIHPAAGKLLAAMNGAKSRQTSSYVDSNGKENVISFYYIWQIDAYVVAPFEYYEDLQMQEMETFLRLFLLFSCLLVVSMILVGIFISHRMTKSVTELVKFTKSITEGKTELRHKPSGNDEIAVLGNHINDMLDKLQIANEQHETEMRANQIMTIQLLQQQINPHLLYNTLDSLLWALQQQRFEEAIPLVTALSEFFRISLSRGRDMIPLRDEIRACEYFLDLQRLARQKSFQLTTQIPEELLNMKIIKLMLQPLVENAVLHGFAGYRDDGVIDICAEVKDGVVVITVEDNGIGMTEDEVRTVNWAIQQFPRPEDFNHFGLYNINRRIVQTYSEQFGLSVQSEISEYTKITIRIPVEEQTDN